MSMKRLAVFSGASHGGYGGLNTTAMYPTPGSPHPPIHGVNVMLGGAMLSGIILVVFVLCYCCHKNSRKPEPNLPYYWREPIQSLEIYTVETQNQCFGSEEIPICEIQRAPPLAPPPPYESVVAEDKSKEPMEGRPMTTDDTGLPSYEAATRHSHIAANGYV